MSSEPDSTPTPLSHGLWGILATPFTGPDLAVDEESLIREVELFRKVGARGVVALGVFGEAAALNSAERAHVVSIVTRAADPLPVVVGLSARSTAMAVEQAEVVGAAARRDLAGLMVQVNSADPVVLGHHLNAVHRATGTGIVVQDYPVVSGVRISAGALLDVLERCGFVVAVKAEAPPTALAISRLTGRTTVPVFGGLGGVGLLDELAAGAAGAMTGFSHPEGLQQALSGFDQGGYALARDAFAGWLPLANFEAQPGVGLALRKEILHRRGIFSSGEVRPPAASLPPELGALIDDHLGAVAGLLRQGALDRAWGT